MNELKEQVVLTSYDFSFPGSDYTTPIGQELHLVITLLAWSRLLMGPAQLLGSEVREEICWNEALNRTHGQTSLEAVDTWALPMPAENRVALWFWPGRRTENDTLAIFFWAALSEHGGACHFESLPPLPWPFGNVRLVSFLGLVCAALLIISPC